MTDINGGFRGMHAKGEQAVEFYQPAVVSHGDERASLPYAPIHDSSSSTTWQDQAATSKFSRWHKSWYQARTMGNIPYESTCCKLVDNGVGVTWQHQARADNIWQYLATKQARHFAGFVVPGATMGQS
ncbi:MAG: hypothetical protein KKG92_06260 [Gammaproteobacteria bacterium]|nr:hypothetical protein [Gammaproteobacteria bacterium]